MISAVACNSKESDDEEEIAVTPALVAVKNFTLKSDDKILANLDSVFFSIDLKTGVIFNADSLPKGTDVSKLVPVITFANSMSKADLSYLKENRVDTVTNYLVNPEDSIDFSYPVTLDVTAQDRIHTFKYTIKVNVHTQDPDSLVWNRLETSVLPSRLPDPVQQKTIYYDDTAYCMIWENNGTYTLAESSDLFNGEWTKNQFSPSFTPDVESLTVAAGTFYLADLTGNIYTSSDLQDWEPTGEQWLRILGAYGDGILGLKDTPNGFVHTQYNAIPDFEETPVGNGFPIFHSSALAVIESQWARMPMAFIACGADNNGVFMSDVWAFDGESWAVINSDVLPALSSPMIARYVVYRDAPQAFAKRAFDVWLLFGGETMSGTMNKNVYISYNNGVNWSMAPASMQMSDKVPSLRGADVIVAGYELSADLSDAWNALDNTKTRMAYEIVGTDINWICPYLYIFGGDGLNDKLNVNIYRGVLDRLRFTPDI